MLLLDAHLPNNAKNHSNLVAQRTANCLHTKVDGNLFTAMADQATEMDIFRKTSINDDLWADEQIPEHTPMKDFYRGKVVFLTGGTGFLGQLYVEKLLR